MTAPTFLRGRKGAYLALGALAVLFFIVVALPLAAMFHAQAEDRQEARCRRTRAHKDTDTNRLPERRIASPYIRHTKKIE